MKRIAGAWLPLVFIVAVSCTSNKKQANTRAVLTPYDTTRAFLETEQLLSRQGGPTTTQVSNLEKLGIIWGFLKYHHPVLQEGKYDWDNQFFGMLPQILQADRPTAADRILEAWVDGLGPAAPCKNCTSTISDSLIKLKPDYGKLFNPGYLPASLAGKLKQLCKDGIATPHYVRRGNAGSPEFVNEPDHGDGFPAVSVRILALFRYWNIIRYYYPYRYRAKNWDAVPALFLPRFIAAKNQADYTLAVLRLVTTLGDAHAGIYVNQTLDSLAGNYLLPIKCAYIEGKVVVYDYITAGKKIRNTILKGDIITRINDTPIDTAINRLLDRTPGASYAIQMSYLLYPRGLSPLIRTHQPFSTLTLLRNDRVIRQTVQTIRNDSSLQKALSRKIIKPKYRVLFDSIGYLDAQQLQDSDFAAMRSKLNPTRGLIIDLRGYPPPYMYSLYGGWLKSAKTAFARHSIWDLQEPGRFNFVYNYTGGQPGVANGRNIPDTLKYNGKIIILVNNFTISRSEYTAMSFSSIPGARVLGSPTAGADGDVSRVPLPGAIETYISGIGIYYPDGSETQGTGVKIDIPVYPSIEGIIKGKDEQLEKAIQVLQK
ncbi:S41 family peptidase [Niabella drilacis]|uniref:Peptidase family S41 n=1 Tax=Niabella drilacis (strain DSM 25811 / CCM 8410 / CCUG 62505 / LMG 26954 / E90) TaxID=1285928 RepID=A0A1G6VWZ0_NIADE|nr:S41 family peptidase [Niabella drilacis]SDD58152.1 Peptidase family S41 [Niabella drilacis]